MRIFQPTISGSTNTTGSLTITGSIRVSEGITGSLFGTSSWATNTLTASFVNTLNQNLIITGVVSIGTGSIGPNENALTLGARDSVNEGGQLGLNAPGGTYTSASMIDNYQNQFRILRGTNASSTGLVASWNLHTLQMQLPAYINASSFTGTATANLAVDSGGNVITVSTAGGTVFPYTGNAVITGSLTTTGIIYAQPNGGMYFQGGDDAALYDINVVNTMGIYGVQDVTVGAIKLGSNGPVLYGSSSKLGIGTTNPSSASLTVNGNVWANSFTGSLNGTASWALNVVGGGGGVTINNNVDNYLITATGTANTLNGESGLTFDGTTLTVGGNAVITAIDVRNDPSTTIGDYAPGSHMARDWPAAGGPSLTAGDIVYFSGSSHWDAAVASATGSSTRVLGVVTSNADPNEILLQGTVTISTDLATYQVGQPVYLNPNQAGRVTNIPPTASGQIARYVGWVVDTSRDQIYFNPDFTWIQI